LERIGLPNILMFGHLDQKWIMAGTHYLYSETTVRPFASDGAKLRAKCIFWTRNLKKLPNGLLWAILLSRRLTCYRPFFCANIVFIAHCAKNTLFHKNWFDWVETFPPHFDVSQPISFRMSALSVNPGCMHCHSCIYSTKNMIHDNQQSHPLRGEWGERGEGGEYNLIHWYN
jgi:hypothetical protein